MAKLLTLGDGWPVVRSLNRHGSRGREKNVARCLSTPINSTDQNLLKFKYELGNDTYVRIDIDISDTRLDKVIQEGLVAESNVAF